MDITWFVSTTTFNSPNWLITRDEKRFSVEQNLFFINKLLEIQESEIKKIEKEIVEDKKKLFLKDKIKTSTLSSKIVLVVKENSNNRLRNMIRQNYVINLYSYFVSRMQQEFQIDSTNHKISLDFIKSTRNSSLEKIKKYYSEIKKAGYDFSSKDWYWIKGFSRLRNCIIHNQGSLGKNNSGNLRIMLNKFVEEEEFLHIENKDTNQIIIDYGFCEKALQLIHKVILEILDIELLYQKGATNGRK